MDDDDDVYDSHYNTFLQPFKGNSLKGGIQLELWTRLEEHDHKNQRLLNDWLPIWIRNGLVKPIFLVWFEQARYSIGFILSLNLAAESESAL